MSRNNVSDHFEAVYLKQNQAKKAFQNTDAIQTLLNSPDFERCVRYMANMAFSNNESVLMSHGFVYEDVLSIVRTLGLQFVNYKFEWKTKRDFSYILMRFIGQKMNTFFLLLNRKFRITENYLDAHLFDLYGQDKSTQPMDELSIDFPEKLPFEEEEVVESVRETGKERKAKADAMRTLLESNIDKYKDQLAEMATSKVVDFQVRKKARQLCRKHGIDYIAWAKAQIATRNLNDVDFVLA
jgi:hypothetical protein